MSCATDGPSLDWYAVYVRHQNEYKISNLVEDHIGVESLVPSRLVWKRRGGKIEVFHKPILPTYVFVKTSLELISCSKFYSIPGFIGFVKQSGSPAPVLEEQVLSLKQLGFSERPVHEMEYMKLKPNDRVRVVDGPLQGAVGSFLRANNGNGRFVVSLDLFQRSMVTELEASLIKAF